MTHTTIPLTTEASIKETPAMVTIDKLLSHVDHQIEIAPHTRNSLIWCCSSRAKLAAELGVTDRTITRCLKDTRLQFHVCVPGDTKVILVRRADGATTLAYPVNTLTHNM